MSGPGRSTAGRGGAVRDLRSKAWCWQDKETIRLIRRHWQSASPEATTLAGALGIYLVLTELASNSNNSAQFSQPRRRIADLAGVSERTLLRYIRAFEALGVLRVEERRAPDDATVQLPNSYALLDPPPATPDRIASTPPDAAGDRPGDTGDAPTLPPSAPAYRPAAPMTPVPAATDGGGRPDALPTGCGDATDREERIPKEEKSQEDEGKFGETIWATARQTLARELTRSNYSTWIEGLRVIAWTPSRRLILAPPNAYVGDWVRTRLRGVIERAVCAAAGDRVTVEVAGPTEPGG